MLRQTIYTEFWNDIFPKLISHQILSQCLCELKEVIGIQTVTNMNKALRHWSLRCCSCSLRRHSLCFLTAFLHLIIDLTAFLSFQLGSVYSLEPYHFFTHQMNHIRTHTHWTINFWIWQALVSSKKIILFREIFNITSIIIDPIMLKSV